MEGLLLSLNTVRDTHQGIILSLYLSINSVESLLLDIQS